MVRVLVVALALMMAPAFADPALSMLPGPIHRVNLLQQANAAYASGHYQQAVDLLQRYHQQAPNDWRGLMKLVQACHAAGLHAEAQVAADALRARWADDPTLAVFDTFLRDELSVNGRRVFVYEAFDAAKLGHRFDVVVTNAAGRPLHEYYVSTLGGHLHRTDASGDHALDTQLSTAAPYHRLRATLAAALARD
ncbi:MAG: tetratricopeptide repeat protein [Candidatus Xenobia bacterium]